MKASTFALTLFAALLLAACAKEDIAPEPLSPETEIVQTDSVPSCGNGCNCGCNSGEDGRYANPGNNSGVNTLPNNENLDGTGVGTHKAGQQISREDVELPSPKPYPTERDPFLR